MKFRIVNLIAVLFFAGIGMAQAAEETQAPAPAPVEKPSGSCCADCCIDP